MDNITKQFSFDHKDPEVVDRLVKELLRKLDADEATSKGGTTVFMDGSKVTVLVQKYGSLTFADIFVDTPADDSRFEEYREVKKQIELHCETIAALEAQIGRLDDKALDLKRAAFNDRFPGLVEGQ